MLQNGGSEIAQPKIDLVSSVVADSPHKVHVVFSLSTLLRLHCLSFGLTFGGSANQVISL